MKNEYSVAAVVFYEKEFLLLKYEMGHWGFVKGNKEKGETNEDTIMRELEEETGITDALIIPGFEQKYDYFYNFQDELIHKYVTCLLIKSNTQQVELSYEHTDYEWLSYEDTLEKLSHENTKEVLKIAKKFLSTRIDQFLK